MGKHDSDTELSDSDGDDDFLRKEIEALSRACGPNATSSSCSVANAGLCLSDGDDDDEEDDLELVRSIQERYSAVAGNVKPLATLPPFVPDDDEEEDDFEFYQSIMKRFSQYACDGASSAHADAAASKDSEHVVHIDETLPNGTIGTSLDEHLDLLRNDIEQEVCDTAVKESASSTSSFPRAAQTFIETIKRNRSCQKFIRNKMLHIEARMEEINEVRKRLKTLRDFQIQCKKKIGRALSQKQDARIQLIAVPKQRPNAKERNVSPMCYGPLENSYVACYKAALGRFPLSFHREKWSLEDRENLGKGIVQQYQENLLQRSVSSVDDLGSTKGVDAMISSVRNHNITPEILQQFSSEVNWEQLASTYFSRRSGGECEARWLNHENQLLNHDYWTADEDKRLLILIQQNGIHDWSGIAEKLGTNRTPFQCLARYQRSLNASILKRDWTVDEDARLRAAVESFGESNWQAVASELEGRTGPQCSNRWKKTLHPAREKVGKWSEDEDKRLKVAVTLFGKSWHRLAQFVLGRTQVQCRERWVNVLDPSLKQGEWTEEEDLKLRAAITEYGYCWSKVAACVPLRTDSQCRRRWKSLFPQQAQLLRAARNVRKVALITNFVDREEERPALGPKDFVSLPTEGSSIEHDNDHGPRELEKSSVTLKKRKRKETTELPNDNGIGPIGEIKKRKAQRSGSKTKKRKKISQKKPKKKSWEGTHSGSDAYAWDIPIRIMSRRARGVRAKVNNPNDDGSVYIGGTDLEQNDKAQSTSSDSQRQGVLVHSSKSKIDSDQSNEWEEEPLSVLYNELLTRRRTASETGKGLCMTISEDPTCTCSSLSSQVS